jgi:hypothetical protein
MTDETTDTDDGHSCTANLVPVVDDSTLTDSGREPILSASISEGTCTVFMRCAKCDTGFDVEYEYVEGVPSDEA